MGKGRKAKQTEKKIKNKNGVKLLVIILVVLILIAGILLTLKILNKGQAEQTTGQMENENKEESQVQIVNENSKTRPYAIMINNNHEAWPQCGLKDAYLIYEIVVEGGITRMMALYKDKLPEKVGSVRSARHYFIDYAEENDAIFIHWGGSPQAYSRLDSGIDSFDGIALEGTVFFRDKTLKRYYEHTGFVNLKKVKEQVENKGYDRDTNKDLLLNYSAEEIDLSTVEGATIANDITLKYSQYHTTSYEYDEQNKVYKRSMSGKANVDLETEEQYTAKNIIIYKVNNYTLSGQDKARQELENIGSGSGYYVSNGYSVPITWEKTSHSGQTVYKYQNGEEITVNDGNTFIQICPTDSTITI
ncbi:MAG: DUF3048 domain-containing protein [Clostridia bacterium]|nr:DUF3048 domain-containing protein [Clostridia bacterium]